MFHLRSAVLIAFAEIINSIPLLVMSTKFPVTVLYPVDLATGRFTIKSSVFLWYKERSIPILLLRSFTSNPNSISSVISGFNV